MKILLAGLFAGALIYLAPHTQAQTPSQLNNSTTRSTTTLTVQAKPVETRPQATLAVAEVKAPTEPQPVVESKPSIDNAEASAKAFIYQRESSGNPAAVNAMGCYGLGQDCNGIVKHKCGASYSCQDHYFTHYMLRRYGSWRAAKSHWLVRVPINGQDVGHWW